jgi:iron-sulfur cluster assembly protein
MSIAVTEKAAKAVKRIINEQQQSSLPPDLLPVFQEVLAQHPNQPALLTELAEKAGVSPDELSQKLGPNAAAFGKIHLRLRVVGGGCSGFKNKLDLDPIVNEKLDEVFEFHGVPVVVDKRSLMYLDNVTVDYHDDLNQPGFSIHNPGAKGSCGCGSSFSM